MIKRMLTYLGAVLAFGFLLTSFVASAAPTDPALACGGQVGKVQGLELLYVSSSDASCPWAFTINAIVIGCEGSEGVGAVVAVTEDGREFAINGVARQWLKLPPIDAIWKAREDIPDLKVNISPWIDVGLALCR